ncbi:hypothetical protein AOL_s00081g205 [Orbilia oligospora ATCC 24927]|uniref:Azaphilone pigments biosynthesis cluster protein L N-terminal domain-containing protein n=1 Tax=Arthrobotrys oligospora (strain ATCC 24927 / CBS 115.81 / DSM 1491) TaxID=756982 RepID=G1XFR2_ARTOA|nr:hypothetical protein AOL_s00081g205 [Orbilia oligospora ATCC 24927]EGX47878.1 hypothetical protein AOL_s00081g205 [Orbilia oligospora ATCC 24927]
MSGLEGLSIGANVIGVLVFGLQAAKFIAESVSKYQDVEDDHRRFLDAIQRLAGVLTDVNEILKTDEDKLRYSRLYTVAKKCENDLIKIHDNILEWTGSTAGKKSKTIRTWKKFKLIFLGDNSKRWLESLESHYGFILFQLNRIQLDDRKEQKVAVGRIESNLAHVSDTILNIEDTQVETLVRIDKVETNITQQIETNSIAVQGLSNSVGVNFTQVNGTLNSIDSLVKLFANNQVYKASEERERDEFEKATGRIFRLGAAAATRRELDVQREQTEQVLEDIRKVLDFAKSGDFSEISGGAVDTDDPKQRSRKIVGLLANSDNLSIGYDTQAFRTFQSSKSSYSVTKVCQWEHQDFSLRVTEGLKYEIPRTKAVAQPDEFSSRVMKITYLPKSTGISSTIDLYLSQSQTLKSPIYAGLCFRATVPMDSPILQAIFFGDLDRVKYLISMGQASIHDCDMYGQNLLTFSLIPGDSAHPEGCSDSDKELITNNRLSIAHFFIGVGIDVNHVDNGNSDIVTTTRLWKNKRGVEILFENGANPMLNPGNIIKYARELNTPEWKRFLDWIIEFYDVNDAVSWTVGCKTRRVPLLHTILWDYATDLWIDPDRLCSYKIKEVVRMLILSGADAFSRTPEGENCLHLVMQATRLSDCVAVAVARPLLKELLLFLIGEIKLDVRGETNVGISVSDLAFSMKCPSGRCLWPVWVAVLLELGYDPLDVARGSICFDKVERLLATMEYGSKSTDPRLEMRYNIVDGHCSCPSCYPDSEDDYVEILAGNLEDEFPVSEGQALGTDTSSGYCLFSRLSPKSYYPYQPSDRLEDYEFFEDLVLDNETDLVCQPNYDASVSDWARILEEGHYVGS